MNGWKTTSTETARLELYEVYGFDGSANQSSIALALNLSYCEIRATEITSNNATQVNAFSVLCWAEHYAFLDDEVTARSRTTNLRCGLFGRQQISNTLLLHIDSLVHTISEYVMCGHGNKYTFIGVAREADMWLPN